MTDLGCVKTLLLVITTRMLSPHETFTKATHLILFLRAEDWLSRFYAARVTRVVP